MTEHLDDATLEALLRGDLTAPRLEGVDAHLDACAPCRARLGSLARSGNTLAPRPIAALEPKPDPYVGTTIAGRYYVHRRIGGGGMGDVYEAEHTLISRRVAIKVLLPQWATHGEVVRRFQNEARAAGSLRHPGILAALDMGHTVEGTPFVVLELLEGTDLEDRVEREGPLPVDVALEIALRVAEALAVAHAAGIVHRDLKPENVFCTTDGGVKVLDFGISKITGALAMGPTTAPGAVMGTPMYMAPEQFEDAARADPRTDVYALGVLLYRCLTGALPHVADTLPALLMAVVAGEVEPLRSHVPSLPEALDRAVLRALRPLPADRFPSMEAFAAELALVNEPDAAPPEPASEDVDFPIEIELDPLPAERRIAAVLAVVGADDPAAIDALVRAHGGACVAHERALLGVFGAGSWHGDEPVRAVRAGLAARPRAEAIAVAAGRVERDEEGVRGEPVERAIAACQAQLEGVAVVAPGTRVTSRFELRAVEGELVEVLRDRGASQPASPLLGRASELAALDEALHGVRQAGRGRALLLVGDIGMGKSRLLHEASDRARSAGFTVFSTRADPHTGLSTRELARRLAESVPLAAAALRAELAGSTPAPARANPSVMADRLELSLRAAIAALAGYGPLILAIDDLQWADAALRAFLERVYADILEPRAAMLLCTARGDELGPWTSLAPEVLALAPLSRDEIARWAARELEAPLPEARIDALVSLTEGNPQFVEQTLAALRAAVHDGDIPLPLDVEAAVEARLARLAPGSRALLDAAAVCFDRFDATTLHALGAEGASHERLRELADAGWLRRASLDEPFELASALIAEVLYRSLPDERRARLHLGAARHLAARSGADREWVAWHFDRAGAAEEAAQEFARVALEAASRGDSSRALRAAHRALTLGVDDGTAFALHLARSSALEETADLEAQGEALEGARALATTPEERARVAAALAVRTLRRRGPLLARPLFDTALEEAARAGDPVLEARAHGALAMAHVALGALDDARREIGAAEELIATRAPSLVANLAGWQAQLAAAEGDLGARRTAFARARRLYLEQGDVRSAAGVAVNLGDALTRFGAYEAAVTALRAALSRCRALGVRRMEGYALANLGRALACVGEPEAIAALEAAEALAAQSGDTHLAAWVAFYRAQAETDPEAAGRAAHAAFLRAEASDLEATRIQALVLSARAAMARADTPAARGFLDAAIEARARLEALEEGEADLFEARVTLLLAEGDDASADEVLAQAREWLDRSAAWIADVALRERFVTDVPVHARLRAGAVRAFPP